MKGIDISYWNGKPDWSKVKTDKAGIGFVYIKATEGITRTEPLARDQAQGAKDAGLRIGYYHFAHLDALAPDMEALAFARRMNALPAADLLPVLDIETNKNHLTAQQVRQWIETFERVMTEQGHPRIMLYSYTPFLNANLPLGHGLGRLPLWVAQYRADSKPPTLPNGWDKYTLWQYSNTAAVAGMTGQVDINVCQELPIK